MNSDGNLDNNVSMLSGAADTEEDSVSYGMPKSPGSFLGSSIRSNQIESFDIETGSFSVTEENPGWRLGMPWFANNNHNKINDHNRGLRTSNLKTQELHKYYGGIMKASGDSSTGPLSPTSTTSTNSRHFRPFRKNSRRSSLSKNGKSGNSNIINKRQTDTKTDSKKNDKENASVPIARTKSNTADSIGDFDESEWTPPDSSYGAACPVCGFIPKRVRQMVEMTLIAAMVFLLIYVLVTISMKIADAHRSRDGSSSNGSAADKYVNGNNYNRTGSSSTTSTNVVTDDDVYVENDNSNYNGDDVNGDDVNGDDGNGDDGNGDDGNGDDATVVDDNYNENEYGVDDDGGSGSDYSQNYYSNNYGNSNQNYNYYNRYDDDYNGERRQLRSSRGKRINIHTRRKIKSIDEILN